MLILKGFLGVIILIFIPSAEGGSQRVRKIDIGKQGPTFTADLVADMAVTPPVLPAENSIDPVLNVQEIPISTRLNNQSSAIITNGDQATKRGFPKESLNRVQDVVEDLTANETNEDIKYEIKSLWLELEEKILSGSLTMPEIIDLLRNKIFEEDINQQKKYTAIQLAGELLKKYPLPDTAKVSQFIDSLRDVIFIKPHIREASIKLIEELLIQYPLSQPEVLKTLKFLRIELSLEQTNSFVRSALIQCMGKILEQYSLPEPEMLQALNQIKEYLFHKNMHIRQDALQVTTRLLKTNKVSDIEKGKTISWITGHLNDGWWRNRVSAIETLNEFLKENIISDPDERGDTVLRIVDRISEDEHWGARKEIIIIASALLSEQDVISDPKDKRDITFKIANRMIEDEDWRVQEEAILISGALLQQQDVLSDPEDRRKIALKIANRISEDENWGVRKQAIITSGALLSEQDILSDPEDRRKIALKIANRISEDEDWGVRKQAIIISSALLSEQDILSDPEDKRKIASMIVDRISEDGDWRVREKAISIARSLLRGNLFDLEDKRKIALKIANRISEDENWGRRKDGIIVSRSLLRGNLFEPEDKGKIASMIVDRISEDEDWRVREKASVDSSFLLNQQGSLFEPENKRKIILDVVHRISEDENWANQQMIITTLDTLLEQQNILSNPNDKRELAPMLLNGLTHQYSKIKKKSIQLSEILLSQVTLSPSKRSEINHIIAMLIFDRGKDIRRIATRMTNKLWTSDLSLSEKLKIIHSLTQKMFEEPYKKRALNVLLAAKQAGLPLDFDMIYKATDIVSDTSPAGKAAENLVREYLNTPSLSDDPDTDSRLRLTLHFKLEQQLAKRQSLLQEQLDNTTACQNSMLAQTASN